MVRVTDIDTSLDFYCTKLGLKEVRRHESEAGKFTLIFLAAPGDLEQVHKANTPVLELTYNWPPQDGSAAEEYTGGRSFGHLAYRVDNIYHTCEQLMTSGITINRPPRDGHMAFIKSPDGIAIELLQKGDALPLQEPWASMPNTGSW